MKNREGGLLIFILPLILLLNPLEARAENKTREEAIFSIKYSNYSNDYTVYLQNDSVFVSLEEVINFLKIYYTVDENHKFEGYVNTKDSSFYIDFNGNEYKDINGVKHKLTDDLWFANELQVYVRTDLLANIFKLEIRSYFNELIVNIESKYELPLLRSLKVEYVSNNFRKQVDNEEFGPLVGSRNFQWLNGGILDYNLGGTTSGRYQSYTFGGNLGLEVLGGEFRYNILGNTYSNNLSYQDRIRWSYLFDSKILHSVSLGDFTNQIYRSSGIMGYRRPIYNLRGVQLTNETQKMPTNFTNYVIEDKIEPDWNVELYLDNQLYDVKRTDLTGYYRFEIPLNYGLTNIKVKYYGPKGEFISEEKALNIPNEFLRTGEIKYTLSAGQDYYSSHKLIDCSGYIGITKWLTTSMAATKIDSSGFILLASQSSLNLFNNIMLHMTATNNGVYEGGLRIPNSFLGSWEFVYTSYDQSFKNSFTQQLSTIQFMTSINNILTLPVTLSIMGTRNQFTNINSNNMNSSLMFNLSSINFTLRHNLLFSDFRGKFGEIYQNVNTILSYYITEMPDFISFLGSTRISSTTNFNPANLKFNDFGFIIEQHITNDIYLNANFTYNIPYKMSTIQIGFNTNLPVFRSRVTANYNQGNPMSYTGDLNGSIEFDSQNMKFNFLNSIGTNNNFGRSSAAIRFYNDKNYNNKFDEGDELIQDADFDVTNGYMNKTSGSGYRILSNLIPGEKYNINVKQESFSNPSMIPDYTEFSFIAEPYAYKAIDIACHLGGMLEGSVTSVSEQGTKGLGGVKIHIVGKNGKFSTVVSVFSDGSYFYSGLPIGDYNIYVDSLQLKILDSKSEPPYIDLTIKPLADGDYVTGLGFTIFPRTPSKGKVAETLENKPVKKDTLSTPIEPKYKNKNIINKINKNLVEVAEPTKPFQEIVNEKVYFYKNTNDFIVSAEMGKFLDSLRQYLKENPGAKISLIGHSDNFSTKENEHAISNKRCQAVAGYLISKGVDKNKILIKAEGSDNPLSPNTTPEGRAKNRRIEIKILK
jgi:outer membrane protein OmpA-like peptidoglycan-associated protein